MTHKWTHRLRCGEWEFAACKMDDGDWLGIAKRGPILADDALSEPGQVWFDFSETYDGCMRKLKFEALREEWGAAA